MPGRLNGSSCHRLQFNFWFQLNTYHEIKLQNYLYVGPMNFFQIFALYITGSLDVVLSAEHRREICRYIYNHQAYQQ